MLKIWAKTTVGDKITNDIIYRRFEKYDSGKFMEYLNEICHDFDIPTPVVLKSHVTHFESFNITRFKSGDFIESVDFDSLVLENAGD
ncbi:MAG: hypothetical protein LBP26_02065 [Clostridiales bacterium]|jgi:hypothetical protein|nr:hypothetical protein [Clostridiales bacterium]